MKRNRAEVEVFIKGEDVLYCSYCGERISLTDKIYIVQIGYSHVELLHDYCRENK